MADGERENKKSRNACDSVEGGYTIILEGARIGAFMAGGDFSSARELDHFKDIGAKIEAKIEEGEGRSLIALSVIDQRVHRDFTVLEIAHILAKHGKRVLIVDCDFLSPGLSGVVEKVEEHGFLDLLLYGSSLTSVARPTGIDGVSSVGPGSFPVSKTIPFALKEFGKVNRYLTKRSDVVIYCSTLYTDEHEVNPLAKQVDGIILTCPIEEMEEGQLQRHLGDLGSDVPPVDLVCFCERKERAAAVEQPPEKRAQGPEERAPERAMPEEAAEAPEEAGVLIEETDEVLEFEERRGGRINIPRLVTIVFGVILAVFIVWWVLTVRSIKRKESSSQMTELVQKQRDAREASERKLETTAADSVAVDEEGAIVGEETPPETVQEPDEAEQAPPPEQTEPKPAGTGVYGVHVHSFDTIERAGIAAADLEKRGYEPEVIESVVRGRKIFRVYVIGFEGRDDAIRAAAELRTIFGYALVKKMKN